MRCSSLLHEGARCGAKNRSIFFQQLTYHYSCEQLCISGKCSQLVRLADRPNMRPRPTA
jgi:hypothetical protein